jgi:hypothetical protein
MRLRDLGLFGAVLAFPPLVALYACGSNAGQGGGGGDGGGSGDGTFGGDTPVFGGPDGGFDVPVVFQDAGFTAPDCPGCTFPGPGAPTCSGAPPINIYYPPDGVLVPPNMNVISVQWTPFGTAFKEFEVDFTNAVTYMTVITKCATQTVDTEQPTGVASGGCELDLDPAMWNFLSNQNRGGDAVTITVRGTTDGTCANTSQSTVRLAFAQEDIVGVIYYWKSTISANGVGGQVWQKSFGDTTPEVDVSSAFGATCNGCHALSRDGARMFIDSDDDDSDDEYGDVASSLVDMSTKLPLGGGGGRGNMPAGFASFYPDHSKFLLSDGNQTAPTNRFYQFDGNTDQQLADAPAGTSAQTPTMEDWGPDGKNVVFVIPQALGNWNGRVNDDHEFGGSLYTMTYSSGTWGPATPLLPSAGENNYYPSYSPDGQLVVFDRAPNDTSAGSQTGCNGTIPRRFCPNDSFSNPAARVMLMKPSAGASVIDLEAANGSPSATPLQWSNSWPKWSPFLQNYKNDKLLWIAFSSTRDYGLRVRNHVNGANQYQCYPSDSYENINPSHHQPFDPACQQPQIWMAAIDVSTAINDIAKDPSKPAFWLPFQDMTTHNHTPYWTQSVAPPPDAGACVQLGGTCNQGGTCCSGLVCQANGTCGQLPQ